jgi:hypothetical protein
VAGMESMAWASMASSLSKQGSPRPVGTLRHTHVTTPPMLSLSAFAASMIYGTCVCDTCRVCVCVCVCVCVV